MPTLHIRTATVADMPEIMRIQQLCYHAIEPESEQSMQAKVLASPQTCLVAQPAHAAKAGSHQLCGYFLAIPWLDDAPPPLNQAHCTLPPQPNCLYLHDLAVDPAHRSSGAGSALVAHMLALLHQSPYPTACLVAIQNASSYWQRHGFTPVTPLPAGLQHKLASYGADAQYLQLRCAKKSA